MAAPSKLIGFVLLAALISSVGPGGSALRADEADMKLPWQEGLIETFTYTIHEEGSPVGEIEQRLYGVTDKTGHRRFKAVYELIRSTKIKDQELIGRSTMEIEFELQTLALLEKTQSYAIGQTQGRVKISRSDNGFRAVNNSLYDGIAREPESSEVKFASDEPLVDEGVLLYMVRALSADEGRTFDASVINPQREGISRVKGKIGGLQFIEWNGEMVEVRRVDVSTVIGTTTYFVRPDEDHTLLRYISPTGEQYDLKP